jgi:hypothetical protein
MNTINKNSETLLKASRDIGLEINASELRTEPEYKDS